MVVEPEKCDIGKRKKNPEDLSGSCQLAGWKHANFWGVHKVKGSEFQGANLARKMSWN